MKERILTNSELGNYSYNRAYDIMEFTWTESCHSKNYGYSSESQYCDNTNNYETSKVKELLEGDYLTSIGSSNLKEVNGYKIRLITLDELVSNLGYEQTSVATVYRYNVQNTPNWVYQNFGENPSQNNVLGYWTMTGHSNYSSAVWIVENNGGMRISWVRDTILGVRPVINLLKSSI